MRVIRLRTVALMLLAAATPIRAQASTSERAANLAWNAAIGGVSGAIGALLRHRDPWKGLRHGLAGGVLMSAGKQVAGARFDGAGFAGRELDAVGVSLIRSAGEDTARYVFPVGPFTAELWPGTRDRFRWRVNLFDAGVITVCSFLHDRTFDWHQALSAGAPVFRSYEGYVTLFDDRRRSGLTYGSVVIMAASDSLRNYRGLLRHEGIHVLQSDYLDQVVTLPIERAIVRKLPGGRTFSRHFDLGLLSPAVILTLNGVVPYRGRPWEHEAYTLSGTSEQ